MMTNLMPWNNSISNLQPVITSITSKMICACSSPAQWCQSYYVKGSYWTQDWTIRIHSWVLSWIWHEWRPFWRSNWMLMKKSLKNLPNPSEWNLPWCFTTTTTTDNNNYSKSTATTTPTAIKSWSQWGTTISEQDLSHCWTRLSSTNVVPKEELKTANEQNEDLYSVGSLTKINQDQWIRTEGKRPWTLKM